MAMISACRQRRQHSFAPPRELTSFRLFLTGTTTHTGTTAHTAWPFPLA